MGKNAIFSAARQILQSKSGIFDEKFNAAKREKGFFPAKDLHRNKSNNDQTMVIAIGCCSVRNPKASSRKPSFFASC